MPALRSVLRPGVSSWKRPEVPPERRPWMTDDLDPEQVAREAVAEIQGALEGLANIINLLRSKA